MYDETYFVAFCVLVTCGLIWRFGPKTPEENLVLADTCDELAKILLVPLTMGMSYVLFLHKSRPKSKIHRFFNMINFYEEVNEIDHPYQFRTWDDDI